MKPLVGKNLKELKGYLTLADNLLRHAERLARGAYGSSSLSRDIWLARHTTAFGLEESRRKGSPRYSPYYAWLDEQLTPPDTWKVKRMKGE